MARSNSNAPWRIYDSDGAQEVVEVRQRFTHSHENDVVDLFTALTFDRDDLIHDFIRAQISRKTIQPACAKFAAVSATDLGRNANRSTVRFFAVERRRRRDQN